MTPDQLETLRHLDARLRSQHWRMSITGPDDADEYSVRIFVVHKRQTNLFAKQPPRATTVLGYGSSESLHRAVLEAWDEASEKKGAAAE
jgi:hypothetical protein